MNLIYKNQKQELEYFWTAILKYSDDIECFPDHLTLNPTLPTQSQHASAKARWQARLPVTLATVDLLAVSREMAAHAALVAAQVGVKGAAPLTPCPRPGDGHLEAVTVQHPVTRQEGEGNGA